MDVEQVMTRDVVSVTPTATLREVAALLSARRISGLPVVDEEGAVVGVVSATDIVAVACGPDPLARRSRGRARRLHGHRARAAAGEAMSAPAVCIGADRPVWEAADLMLRRRVDRLPVLGASGGLVGIVTRADLVRVFVRPDGEIERDILAQLPQNGIDVEVSGGEATLRGVVASRAAAADAALAAARTPGVVGVNAKLIWGQAGLLR